MPNEPALWRARTYPYRLDSGSRGLWPAPQYFMQRLMDRWCRLSVDRGFEASANPRGELEHDRPRRGFDPPPFEFGDDRRRKWALFPGAFHDSRSGCCGVASHPIEKVTPTFAFDGEQSVGADFRPTASRLTRRNGMHLLERVGAKGHRTIQGEDSIAIIWV